MSAVHTLIALGPALLVGSTVLLGTGVVLVRCVRAPVQRQRLAELTLAVGVAWIGLALVPLPRWLAAAAPESSSRGQPLQPSSSSAPAPFAADNTLSPSDVAATGLPPHAVPPALFDLATGAVPVQAAPDEVPARFPTDVASEHLVSDTLPVEPATAPTPLQRALALGFLGISGIALLYLGLGAWRLRRLLAGSLPAPDWVLAELHRDGVPEPPRGLSVRVSELCGPFCVGVRRPVIVLPRSLVDTGSLAALRPILAHELAHARQGDGRGQLLAALALPLFWCHPFYWWLRTRMRFMAEVVADDLATRSMTRPEYARRLIDLAERTSVVRPAPLGATTVFGSRSEFTRRIEMLLQHDVPLADRCSTPRRGLLATYAGALLVTASGLWGAPPVVAQDAAASNAAEVHRLEVERARLQDDVDRLESTISSLQAEAAELTARMHAADAARTAEAVTRSNRVGVLSALGYVADPAAGARDATIESARPASAAQTALAPPGLTQPTVDYESTLSLVIRALDLQTEIQMAQLEIERLGPLAERELVAHHEVARAEVRYSTLKTKLEIVRSVIVAELRATELELNETTRHMELGLTIRSEAQLTRLRARLEILTRAL